MFCQFSTPGGNRCTLSAGHGGLHQTEPYSSGIVAGLRRQEGGKDPEPWTGGERRYRIAGSPAIQTLPEVTLSSPTPSGPEVVQEQETPPAEEIIATPAAEEPVPVVPVEAPITELSVGDKQTTV